MSQISRVTPSNSLVRMPFVAYSEHHERKEIRHTKQLFHVLKFYFLIHGLCLPVKNTSEIVSKISCILTTTIAIVFEIGITLYFVILTCENGVSKYTKIMNLVSFYSFLLTGLIQRYFLFSKRKTMEAAIDGLIKIYDKHQVKSKVKCQLLFLIIITETLLGIYTFSGLVAVVPNFSDNSSCFGISYPKDILFWYYVSAFIAFYKNTLVCINVYFFLVCRVLTNILRHLEEVFSRLNNQDGRMIEIYNKTRDIMKAVNGSFRYVLFLGSWCSLITTFNHVFYFVKEGEYGKYAILCKIMGTLNPFGSFMLMCLSASSVKTADEDLRYLIESLPAGTPARNRYFKQKLRPQFTGFTLLDSLVIDKSLIFTAVATFVTYGVVFTTLISNSR